MTTLPQEIIDKIFLELDYKTLKSTRDLQSDYVKSITMYKNMNDAAENGKLENMKWLKEQGCPWDSDTFKFAAKNGNLENMKWLRSQGCPWDSDTFKFAAKNGNLENMKWLRSQGCPWDLNTNYYSRVKGNLETIKWLDEQGCPSSDSLFRTIALFSRISGLSYAS